MKRTYRDIFQHSAVYGIGQILLRAASIFLLPVYTRYLRPDDYGALAILDLGANVLSILIGAGMAAAVARYHFDTKDPEERKSVWWTGLGTVAASASIIALVPILFRDSLSRMLLGDGYAEGATFVVLALLTLWFGAVTRVPMTLLRIQKRSALFVALALASLLVNIAINVTLLVVYDWGVMAMLVGNLITAALRFVLYTALLRRSMGPPRWSRSSAQKLFRFGGPIMATSLLALVMHQADRYFLRVYLDMSTVGLYSVAYAIGQGVNSLMLIPFGAIWRVSIYEIAAEPDAKYVYSRVFGHFFDVVIFVMLSVSVLAYPILRLIAAEEYASAAQYVPPICLAYAFFSLHEHFKVPALLAKRTLNLLPAFVVAAIANIGLNMIMIPILGGMGAALVTVGTFALFSTVGLLAYRRIDKIPYNFTRCAGVLLTCGAAYFFSLRTADWVGSPWRTAASAAAILIVTGAIVLGPLALWVWRKRGALVQRGAVVEGPAPHSR